MDVLESERLLEARLSYTVAFAALHANPSADFEKGADRMYDMYARALDSVPYITAASGSDKSATLQTEREEAIKKWRQLQADQGKDSET